MASSELRAIVDLRSDTATRPTAAMRDAMAAAAVGDEQLGEDPTTRALEERMADLLGKEDAVFVCSGTMANNIAVMILARPGEAILAEQDSHIATVERSGITRLAGVVTATVAGVNGVYGPVAISSYSATGYKGLPRLGLICIEQTHNFAGGTVWSLESYRSVCDAARVAGAAVLIDGARLFNAMVATTTPAPLWAETTDAIWVDFSKGMGCPTGAVLAGSTEFIREARGLKISLGGGMRQSGILAAACLHALDHHLDRLVEDHELAKDLASRLSDLGLPVRALPETNIVLLDLPGTHQATLDAQRLFREGGVAVSVVGRSLRLVTHLDVSPDDLPRILDVSAKLSRTLEGSIS